MKAWQVRRLGDRSRRCSAGGRIAEAPTNHVLVKNYSVVGMHWGLYTRVMPGLIRSTHENLIRLYDYGEIDPLISGTTSFEELPQALVRLGSRGTYCKIVTTPTG